MKLTADQRKLLDDTVLAIVRTAPHALCFTEINARTRAKIAGSLGEDWTFRFIDGALQRLRKAGLIKTARKRWTAAPQPVDAREGNVPASSENINVGKLGARGPCNECGAIVALEAWDTHACDPAARQRYREEMQS